MTISSVSAKAAGNTSSNLPKANLFSACALLMLPIALLYRPKETPKPDDKRPEATAASALSEVRIAELE